MEIFNEEEWLNTQRKEEKKVLDALEGKVEREEPPEVEIKEIEVPRLEREEEGEETSSDSNHQGIFSWTLLGSVIGLWYIYRHIVTNTLMPENTFIILTIMMIVLAAYCGSALLIELKKDLTKRVRSY